MPRKMSDPGTMPEKLMKSGGDAEEDEEIQASFGEGPGQAPEKCPGKHRRTVRASTEKGRTDRVLEKVEFE